MADQSNRLNQKNAFKVLAYLQKCHEQHLEQRPTYAEVATCLKKEVGQTVAPGTVRRIAKNGDCYWIPRSNRSTRSQWRIETLALSILLINDALRLQLDLKCLDQINLERLKAIIKHAPPPEPLK